MRRNSAFSISVVSVCLFAPSLHAQDDNARRLSELARNAAQQFASARAEVDQTRPAAGIATPGPNVELSLDEATTRALERNLDIAVERLNPQLQEYSLTRLRAIYRPVASSTIGQRAVVQPPTNQLNGGNIVQNDTSTFNGGMSQSLPWGGGEVAFQFNNAKQVTSNIFANFNPTYTANFAATFTQPLMRDFTIDLTRQQIKVTTINRDISEIQLRGTLATTVANVRNAYWELLFSVQAVDVAKGSLELADKLVEDNRARVEVGTMAPLDVVAAEAESANRRQALALAEATMQTAEIILKRLIVNGTDDPMWRSHLTPIDRPEFRPEPLDVEGAVTKAFASRTDLEQARRTIDSNDVTIGFLRNQTLPAVDFIGSYNAQGLGGTQFIRQGSGLGSTIIGTIPGGYGDAWSTLAGRELPHLERAGQPLLSAGRQRHGRQLRQGARPAQPVGRAAPRPRTPGRGGSDQRGAASRKQPEAVRGVGRGARSRANAASSRAEPLRSGALDELLRRPGATRPGDGAEHRIARAARLPSRARGLRPCAGSPRGPRRRHHGDSDRRIALPGDEGTVDRIQMQKIVMAVVAVGALAGGVLYLRSGDADTPTAGQGAAAEGGGGRGGRRGGGAGGFGGGQFGRPPMTVELGKASRASIKSEITVVGNLIGQTTVTVAPRAAGRLQDISVRLGDRVSRGQRVARLEDFELQEQVKQAEAAQEVSMATIRQREADLQLAQTNAERSRNLFQRQLLPKQTLDDNESRYLSAVAAVDLARAQASQSKARLDELRINLGNMIITSPVNGFVSRRVVDPGAFVSQNAPIVDVVDITTVRLVANIIEKDLTELQTGDSTKVEVDAYPGEEFMGRIARVSPVLDPATRTAPIEIEIPNPGYRLKPGMYARVSITTDTQKDALVVPADAVVDLGGRRGVFTPLNESAVFRALADRHRGREDCRDSRRPGRGRRRHHHGRGGASGRRPHCAARTRRGWTARGHGGRRHRSRREGRAAAAPPAPAAGAPASTEGARRSGGGGAGRYGGRSGEGRSGRDGRNGTEGRAAAPPPGPPS